MDIYELIRNDHNTVNALFQQAIKATSINERRELATQIHKELTLHAQAEEETFYNAIETARKEAEDEIEHAEHEHDDIRKALTDFMAVDAANAPVYLKALDKLVSTVTHHVSEEESEVFDEAREALSDAQAEELAKAMSTRKKELEKTLFRAQPHAA